MRKLLFLALTLLTVVSATLTLARPVEAACFWYCGECGVFCSCDRCFGPPPPCVCT